MKRRLGLMLSLFIPLMAWSADGEQFTEESNGITLTYTIVSESDKTCETAAQTSLPVDAAIDIPATTANGYKVIGIGYRSFKSFAIKSISFPSGLKYIGEEAFEGCGRLALGSTLIIPRTVTRIGRQAFKDSGVQFLNIQGGLNTVGTEAFRDCTHLNQVTMGEGVTTIGESMFSGCTNLWTCYFPSTITSVGKNAFSGTAWYTDRPEGMTYIGTIAYKYKDEEGNTDAIVKVGTKSIYSYAFSGSKVTSVTIATSVTSIGEYAFENCSSLTTIEPIGTSSTYSVYLDEAIEEIGKYAFSGCTKLVSVKLPSTLETISDGLFDDCTSLTSVTAPLQLRSIGSSAFSGCSNLASYNIPNSVTSIGSTAFYGCEKLTTINIPQGVTAIGQMTFEGCKGLTSVKLHEGITSIGIRAFSGCTGLTEITIPGTLRTMETWDNCWAFSSCTELKKITINKGAALLGANTFQGCGNVETVVCLNQDPISVYDSFKSFASNATLYVPAGRTAAYAEASYWKDFKSIVEMPDNVISFKDSEVRDICISNWDANGDGFFSTDEAAAVTDIGSAFKSKSKIRWFDELSYFTGITSIPSEAFNSCTNLISITIPENVTKLNEKAFSSCISLTSITLPGALTGIGSRAFEYCSSLTLIDIPSSVETIGFRAFRGCKGFVTMDIPNGVKSLGDDVFRECTNLASVSFPESLSSIGTEAFRECPALEALTVDDNNATFESPQGSNAIIEKATKTLVLGCKTTVIPADVEHIGKYAFINCTGLTSIDFPDALTTIGDYAFNSCSALTSITLPANVSSIGEKAFYACSSLAYITALRDTPAELGKKSFPTISNVTLYVPAGRKDAYETAWGSFKEIVELTDGASFVVSYPFGNITYKILSNTDKTCEVSYSSSLKGEVVIPSSVNGYRVIGIGALAFEEEEDFTSIVIPSSITYMRDRAFRRTYPESVYISDLEAWCNIDFDGTISNPIVGCNLYLNGELVTDLVIPNSITAIKPCAFCYCKSITSVTLHENVASIGEYAFSCSGLISVTVGAFEPVAITSEVFSNRANATLHVPAGSKAAYEAADYWKEFGEIIEKEPEVPVNEIWSGSQVIKEWSNLTLGKEYMESLNIGDVLHVTVTDVAESEANVALLDGSWTGIAPWYGLSPEMTEAVFTLTGDMVRELKRYGMVLSCHGYTIKRIYTTPAYTGSENSIWLGNQINGDISVGFDHFHIANRKTGIKAGDVIRLSYTGNGTPNLWYIGDDWTWKKFTDATLSTTETGAEVTVTGAMATLLNNDKVLIVQLGDAGLTLTQVELISGAHTVVYQVGEGETFASGTQKELENITLIYGETGGVDFQTATAWTCEAEGLEFPYYSPGNGVNGNKDGGTFYVFKPKKNGLLTVVVNQNAIKPFYVEENGSVMDQFNGITKGEDGTYQGTYKIEVKANRTYKVYCSGSKLGFYGFIYDWRDNAHLINIEFADANVKALCVANWDTNKDGELSEAEAAAVTDLGEVFKENTEITSFDEFEYFSGVTELSAWMAFEGCTALKSIIIPAGVTRIDGAAFANCAALETISIDAMNSIYESPAGCNAVIEKTSNKIVVGCANTVIPNTVTTIGDASFWGRWGMASIDIPESVTVIEQYAFTWSNMSEFTMPSKVEIIDTEAFAYTGLKSVTLPATLTAIGDEAFNGCNYLVEVTVENPMPVAITADVFSNRANATLYVPGGCVAAYGAADYWKEFGTIMSYGSSSLYAEDLQTLPGTTAVLAVNLDNVDEAIACKFDLRLPAGVAVATTSNGKLDATLTERAENHSISSSHLDNGDYRFVITSQENDLFTGNSGALVEIRLDVPLTMECGDYTVQVLNTDLTALRDNTSTNVKLDDMDSKLTVTYTRGDVNCDGSVSVTDVGCTINYILERVPEVFVKEAADMDGDNEINVTDVTKIIDFILDDDASMAPRRSGYDPVIPHLSLQQTADGYALTMDEKNAFVGFQFDVELAAGATVNSMQLNSNSDHLLTYRRLDNGMYRVVCYSLSNSTFANNDTPLLNMSVTGDVSVSSVLLTTAGLTGLRATVSDDQSTGIASMNQGLQMSVQGRTLQIVADRDVTLRLYTTGGSVYRVLNVHSGVNTFEGLKAGVYMIENRKMIIR